MPLGMKVGLGPGHIVQMGSQPPSKKWAQPPIFGPCLLWPNGRMDQDTKWYEGRPRPGPHCVRWRPSSPSSKGTHAQCLAHVCCGQTAGWIKRPLATEVHLDPGDIVLDGNFATPKGRGHSTPHIWPMYCGQTAAWINMPLRYGGRPRPRPHCVTCGPSSPEKGI